MTTEKRECSRCGADMDQDPDGSWSCNHLYGARLDIPVYSAEIAAHVATIAELTQQVSRLTEALRGIYATKVRRSGGSFGFNIKFNGIYSRELSDLIYLTPPAARQGEKEKP